MTARLAPGLLEVDDLSATQVRRILDRARAWKREPARVPRPLTGRSVALLFEKPSARTRASTEAAVASLGGHPIALRPDDVGFGVRESVADVTRTLASYCVLIGARVFDHGVLHEMAEVSRVPVVNLLSDRAHPLQGLADLLTLLEHFGSLEGRRVAYVGDGNNVCASLAIAAALTGLEVAVATPAGFELDEPVVACARNLGGVLDATTDPFEAVRGADAVYTDVWTSMGQEQEMEERRAAFAAYQVNQALMDVADPNAVFLHCLPAHRGEEVTDDVLGGPASLVWQQAENRMHAARATIVELLGEA